MTPWLDDGDIRLYHGDALETVRQLPAESVDCVVTSPPYWGLRDYGTGEWDGGDPGCDHIAAPHSSMRPERSRATSATFHGSMSTNHGDSAGTPYRKTCGQCGARRVDQQMGLEETPDLFVAGMVELFREIRRVLAPHGTCWVNLGDSYAGSWGAQSRELSDGDEQGANGSSRNPSLSTNQIAAAPRKQTRTGAIPEGSGLKPKDLVGIPWRVAFALQADGWWLRSDIIWAKPNPMPESVTDRPTKAHEYVFLLTKQPRYWFDAEAVREPSDRAGETIRGDYGDRSIDAGVNGGWLKGGIVAAGRNVRSVWQIATQPYPEAHFATYPEELARRCILAGCPVRVCRVCGKPSERIVEVEYVKGYRSGHLGRGRSDASNGPADMSGYPALDKRTTTTGWTECDCDDGDLPDTPALGRVQRQDPALSGVPSKWRPGVVLDPFIGSGTTAKVARDHQRHAIGIDLNEVYLDLAARRLQQLSLLNDSAA